MLQDELERQIWQEIPEEITYIYEAVRFVQQTYAERIGQNNDETDWGEVIRQVEAPPSPTLTEEPYRVLPDGEIQRMTDRRTRSTTTSTNPNSKTVEVWLEDQFLLEKDNSTELEDELDDPEKTYRETRCRVCLEKRANALFIDCGHVACGTCALKISKCHICRRTIMVRRKIFLA